MNINSINPNMNKVQSSTPSREMRNEGNTCCTPTFGAEIKSEKLIKKINWLGDGFSSAMQRGVSGVTAILTQPFFDWNNKNTDEETRKTSTARILGKIISGTLTGVTIRWACVKAAENFCKTADSEKVRIEKAVEKAKEKSKTFTETAKTTFSKREQWLLPEKYKTATYREVKKYKGAIGTFAAVLIMIATNFLIDVPLTTMMTNFFNKMFHKGAKPTDQQSVEGGKQ